MTLILWKAPVVDDPDEAARLLEPYYERSDDSAFEPSPDIARVSNELLRRFPDLENGPWADELPPEEVDRVLLLTIRWSADNAVLNAIIELARENDLVVYDPQGPSLYLPTDPPAETGPVPRPSVGDHLKVVGMGIVAAAVFLLGYWIRVPILRWILMIVGGFFFSVILFLLAIFIFGPNDDDARRRPVPERPNER